MSVLGGGLGGLRGVSRHDHGSKAVSGADADAEMSSALWCTIHRFVTTSWGHVPVYDW